MMKNYYRAVYVFVFSVFFSFMNDDALSGNVSWSCDVSSKELHDIAWPVAREHYNRTVAQPKNISVLEINAFERPATANLSNGLCYVTYGGNKAGPVIRIAFDADRNVQSIQSSFASK